MSKELDSLVAQLPQQLNEHGDPIGLAIDDWQTCQSPSNASLWGQYCRLERFDVDAHCTQLHQAFEAKERNWTYLPYGPFKTAEEFTQWCKHNCLNDDPLFFAVIDLKSAKAVGMASYLRIAENVGCIEVGHIHFSSSIQKSRVATEAMYLMMKRVFDELGYRRYEWKCNALNAPSCKAAERFGFTFEGVFRQAAIAKQRNRDTAWFSILDNEWPKLRAGFESWLSADNFDNDGVQRKSLKACCDKQ